MSRCVCTLHFGCMYTSFGVYVHLLSLFFCRFLWFFIWLITLTFSVFLVFKNFFEINVSCLQVINDLFPHRPYVGSPSLVFNRLSRLSFCLPLVQQMKKSSQCCCVCHSRLLHVPEQYGQTEKKKAVDRPKIDRDENESELE